jgi:hypothetical protein
MGKFRGFAEPANDSPRRESPRDFALSDRGMGRTFARYAPAKIKISKLWNSR